MARKFVCENVTCINQKFPHVIKNEWIMKIYFLICSFNPSLIVSKIGID